MSNHWYSKMGSYGTLHFGDGKSFFTYRTQDKFAPLFPQFFELISQQGHTYTPSDAGGEMWSFVPTQAGRRLAEVTLYIRLPALQIAAGSDPIDRTSEVLCYHNDLAHRLFNRIELVDGSDVLDTIYPEVEHLMMQLTKRNETRQTRDLLGWFDSEDDLNDRAAQPQDLYWTIPFHFSQSLDRALRMDELTGHDLRFRFYWNKKGEMVYNSTARATADFTFSEVKLYMTYYPLAKPEQSVYRQPFVYRTLSYQKKAEYRLSGAESRVVIPLNNFSFLVSGLIIRLREDATPPGADRFWTNSTKILKMKMVVDGTTRYETLPVKFLQEVLLSKMFPSLPEEQGWHYYTFNPAPMLLPDIVAGGLNFSEGNEFNLEIELSTPVAGYVDILGITPNFFEYKIEADRTRMSVWLK